MIIEERTAKRNFVKNELFHLLKAYNNNVTACEYGITEYNIEYVIVWFENKWQRKINVTADSLRAIVLDVVQRVP